MKKEVLINKDNLTIKATIKKNKAKRLKIKIANFNQEFRTYDVEISCPMILSYDRAIDFFLKNFSFYDASTAKKTPIIIGKNEALVNGKIINKKDEKKEIIETIKKVECMFKEKAQEFKTDGVTLSIRQMKSSWGLYHSKNKVITLNKALLRVPDDLILYVICHELTHYYYLNHSKDFYCLLKSFYPNFKEAKSRLKNYSSQF